MNFSIDENNETEGRQQLNIISIFLMFMKISPFTFGGGIAILPYIESEIVKKRKWMKKEDIPNIVTVAQSSPGSVAINTSIYIGYTLQGLAGAISAVFGMIFPAAVIIIILTYMYMTYQELSLIQDAFKGIRPAIVGLIMFTAYKIGKKAIHDRFTMVVFLLAAGLLLTLAISPFLMIIGGGLAGVIYQSISNRR
ncbi:chromate transporter [Thalassobacillus devorans]|uniref:chromate transporter n=2 Tax=Thalassobacillus devorans TaxID=279813 RepID=UPI000783ACF0